MDPSRTIFNKSSQLLGLANDLEIMGRNMYVVEEKFVALEQGGSNCGEQTKVNNRKTEYMIVSPFD